eukprot:7688181-Pyramimonas_sp.AAC.1
MARQSQARQGVGMPTSVEPGRAAKDRDILGDGAFADLDEMPIKEVQLLAPVTMKTPLNIGMRQCQPDLALLTTALAPTALRPVIEAENGARAWLTVRRSNGQRGAQTTSRNNNRNVTISSAARGLSLIHI